MDIARRVNVAMSLSMCGCVGHEAQQQRRLRQPHHLHVVDSESAQNVGIGVVVPRLVWDVGIPSKICRFCALSIDSSAEAMSMWPG